MSNHHEHSSNKNHGIENLEVYRFEQRCNLAGEEIGNDGNNFGKSSEKIM